MDYVEVEDCLVIHTTPKAVLLRCGGFKMKAEWIPIDCVEDNGEALETGSHYDRLYIQESMAIEKGLA